MNRSATAFSPSRVQEVCPWLTAGASSALARAIDPSVNRFMGTPHPEVEIVKVELVPVRHQITLTSAAKPGPEASELLQRPLNNDEPQDHTAALTHCPLHLNIVEPAGIP